MKEEKESFTIDNLEQIMVEKVSGYFHLFCCDCGLRHQVFLNWENKEKTKIKIGFNRDDYCTRLERIARDRWDGERCKHCGRPYRMGYKVSDKIWKKVVPPKFQNSTLCLDCFDALAYEKKIKIKITKLWWAGHIDMPKNTDGSAKIRLTNN